MKKGIVLVLGLFIFFSLAAGASLPTDKTTSKITSIPGSNNMARFANLQVQVLSPDGKPVISDCKVYIWMLTIGQIALLQEAKVDNKGMVYFINIPEGNYFYITAGDTRSTDSMGTAYRYSRALSQFIIKDAKQKVKLQLIIYNNIEWEGKSDIIKSNF